ncbi:unnamed protein product [Colias eurytheme]|nr:unnamed protein product [Colias eurytheme]
MEPSKTESPRIPDMMQLKLHRMCGDHPSVTKTELNIKEEPKEEKEKDKKMSASFGKISPSTSRTDRPQFVPDARVRSSDHTLRRRALSMDTPLQSQRNEPETINANRALLQAAMGSLRWPPYLVCVWVCVLLLSHALHGLVALLERALPNVRKLCIYLRTWTVESWRSESEASRVCPLGLACATALLYTLYCALYALHAAALWAVEPLASECADVGDRLSAHDVPKITDYIQEMHKTSSSFKC